MEAPSAIDRLISRCQVLAGSVLWDDPASLHGALSGLIEAVPDELPSSQQLVARALLLQTFGRVARQLGIERNPDVTREYLVLGTLAWGSEWRVQWRRLVASYASAIAARGAERARGVQPAPGAERAADSRGRGRPEA